MKKNSPKTKIIFTYSLNIFIYLVIIFFVKDFREPLTEGQVKQAVEEYYFDTHTVRRISLYQGKPAGQLGYFFVELNPKGYIIIVNDARFPLDHVFSLKQSKNFRYYDLESENNFVQFMVDRPQRPPQKLLWPRFNSSIKLDIISLINKIFRVKTHTEIFWEKFNEL